MAEAVNVRVGQSAMHVVAPSSEAFVQLVAVVPVCRHTPTSGLMVKGDALTADCPPTVTVMMPEVAAAGTLTVMDDPVLAVTSAFAPLNFTSLLAGVELKLTPLSVTVLATGPEVGEKAVIDGAGAGSDLLQERSKEQATRISKDFMKWEW